MVEEARHKDQGRSISIQDPGDKASIEEIPFRGKECSCDLRLVPRILGIHFSFFIFTISILVSLTLIISNS
jgi:hypothetical protein